MPQPPSVSAPCRKLNKLNANPGTATDAMALFLAINTSSVTLLPTGVIALRAAAGSADPAAIFPTTLFATACSTLTAVISAKLLCRLYRRRPQGPKANETAVDPADAPDDTGLAPADHASYPVWMSALTLGGLAALIPLTVAYGKKPLALDHAGLDGWVLIFGVCAPGSRVRSLRGKAPRRGSRWRSRSSPTSSPS